MQQLPEVQENVLVPVIALLPLITLLVSTGLLVALISGMSFKHGLRTTALALVSGAAGSILIAGLTVDITARTFPYLIAAIVVGLVGGPVIRFQGARDRRLGAALARIALRISILFEDVRVIIITLAFAAAITLTFPFGWFALKGGQASFWFGFYQAWTAGLVAFVLLGAGTTFVSLYRPEMENFRKRVRILFGTHDENTIDYLVKKIEALGYYSVSMERKYIIEEWCPQHDAFWVKVEHTTITRNFLHDVSVPDKALFVYNPDIFDPPISVIGHLTTFEIDGQSKLVGPIVIPPEGKRVEHDMTIPAGGEATTYVEYRCLFKVNISVIFRASRYLRSFKVSVCNRLKSGEEFKISVLVPRVSGDMPAVFGQPINLDSESPKHPGDIALEFVIQPPCTVAQ